MKDRSSDVAQPTNEQILEEIKSTRAEIADLSARIEIQERRLGLEPIQDDPELLS